MSANASGGDATALEYEKMYEIQKDPWGYRLTFGGFISKDEMAELQ